MSPSARPNLVSPPPIGEALSVGWKTFQQNPVPILLGTICAMVIGLIPILGALTAPIAPIAMAYAYEKTFGAFPATS